MLPAPFSVLGACNIAKTCTSLGGDIEIKGYINACARLVESTGASVLKAVIKSAYLNLISEELYGLTAWILWMSDKFVKYRLDDCINIGFGPSFEIADSPVDVHAWHTLLGKFQFLSVEVVR